MSLPFLDNSTIAGAGAGAMASFIVCPLDVVKIRLQNQGPFVTKYSGTLNTLRIILREEGMRGWYRGLGPTLLGYLPTWAIYFTVYEKAKATLHSIYHVQSSSGIHLTSAIIAGFASTLATNPLWVIRTRLMTQSRSTDYYYRNTFDAFRVILATEGIAGLYKGLTPSLMGLSHVAVQFTLYERLKSYIREIKGKGDSPLTTSDILVSSVCSKIVASICTYPHEILRTRLHSQTSSIKYPGLIAAIKIIGREEGWRGFYKGMSTNIVRVIPSAAITLVTYEFLLDHLNKY